MKYNIIKIILFGFTMACSSSNLMAADYLFTGSVDSDWFNASNWSTVTPYNGYPGSTTTAGDDIYYDDHLVINNKLINYATIKPSSAGYANPACSLEINIPPVFMYWYTLENYGGILFKDADFQSGYILNNSGGNISFKGNSRIGQVIGQANMVNGLGSLILMSDNLQWDGHIENEGDIHLLPATNWHITCDSMLNGITGYISNNNATIIFDGIFTNAGWIYNGGTMQGTGTINGPGSADNGNVSGGGIVAPGLSPGELIVDCNYNQGPYSFYKCEINGTTPGTDYDVLGGIGDKNLDGFLEVILDNSFVPAIGTSFTIIKGTINGVFSNVIYPPLPIGRKWEITYNANEVILSVVVQIPLAVKDRQAKSNFDLYPNPANNVLNIKGVSNAAEYAIYNLAGQKQLAGKLLNNQVPTNTLSPGIHILYLQEGDQVEQLQFVKQ